MSKKSLFMSFSTMKDTTQWSVGKELLDAFANTDKRLVPEHLFQWSVKLGNFETVNACQKHWVTIGQIRSQGSMSEFPVGLRWKRQRTAKYEAEMKHTQRNKRGRLVAGSFDYYGVYHKKINWNEFFEKLCKILEPSHAMLHNYVVPEMNNWSLWTSRAAELGNLSHSCLLPETLVDETLAKTITDAGFPIQKFGEGYLLQVTEDLHDVVNDFPMFSARRAKLKSLFPDDYFQIKNEPEIL